MPSAARAQATVVRRSAGGCPAMAGGAALSISSLQVPAPCAMDRAIASACATCTSTRPANTAIPCPSERLADRIEHDHGDLASTGLELIVGVGREKAYGLGPQLRPLGAGGDPGACLHLRGADLDLHGGIGLDVAEPAGMLGRAAFR